MPVIRTSQGHQEALFVKVLCPYKGLISPLPKGEPEKMPPFAKYVYLFCHLVAK